MTFEELFNKYVSDDEFKKEAGELLTNEGIDALINKYDLPYTKDELAELIKSKAECSNCSNGTIMSLMTLGVACAASAISGCYMKHGGNI